ncbi:MAG: iron-only hydrogenase system regulator [Synergistaceae bacterium]
MQENKIAVVAIIVEDSVASPKVNEVLHKFGELIVGRLGIPYRERKLNVISIIVDGEPDEISALTGQLGKIEGVTVKAAVSKK